MRNDGEQANAPVPRHITDPQDARIDVNQTNTTDGSSQRNVSSGGQPTKGTRYKDAADL